MVYLICYLGTLKAGVLFVVVLCKGIVKLMHLIFSAEHRLA